MDTLNLNRLIRLICVLIILKANYLNAITRCYVCKSRGVLGDCKLFVKANKSSRTNRLFKSLNVAKLLLY